MVASEIPPVTQTDVNGPDVEEVKNILKSKTFWWNVIAIGLEVVQVLPVPPGTIAVITSVGNILLRVFTDKPVTILPQK